MTTTEQQKPSKQERLANKVRIHLDMTVREIFDGIEEDHTRPANMAYFDRIFKAFIGGGKDVVQIDDKRQMVGTYCVFVPEELIYASGARPVRLCAGAYESVEIGEDHLPDVACPMVKSEMGFSTLPVLDFYQRCDLVALPTSCDWKKKIGEMMAEHHEVHMLSLPSIKELESSRTFWLEEVKRFKESLEKLTGTRINRKRLTHAIRRIQRAQREVHRFQELRKHIPAVIHGRDALEVLNAYFYDEVEPWTKALADLNDELEKRIADEVHVAKPKAARLMLTGSPMVFPNWKIPTVIEELGAVLVTDEFCTSGRYLSDMVSVDEGTLTDMLHAIADRYMLPCSCPTFTNTTERRDRVLQLARDYQVDGVIYHTFKGCHPFDIEAKAIETMLQQNDIPMLKIETDYAPQDIEQLRTRIEAFTETLRGRERQR
ncbi:MAG: 2-hydroxyacyl-CoA dehydratase [Hyphomicrobiales bacterium]|nr:MAG: 2-hydroxyacyl-CoA dehydratase [Hyphomicrobiales bacterium]